MSVIKENWQTTILTIKERSKFMFNNDLLSDVKFVVRGSNGESKKSKKVIPAHKFVLSISSPVFLTMFYGELAETTDSIDLPDCEYEGLLELFRYLYSDEVKLSGNNVLQVWYLAKKYMVPSLADKCIDYLQKNLDASNVFCVLPHAQKYEEKNLVDQCWYVIDTYTEKAVKSDAGFGDIERSLLETIVERDCLAVTGVTLFKAVDLWATQECERQGLQTDGPVKRRVLGERIVKGIRFPLMKQKEFARVVIDSKILTQEEVFDLIKYLNSVLASPVGFSEIPRFEPIVKRCCRFGSLKSTCDWVYDSCSKDFLIMSVSKNVKLHGLCMFGYENSDYHVKLVIKDVISGSVVASKSGLLSTSEREPGNEVRTFFPSVRMQYKSIEFYGFDVLFDYPVFLKKGIKYCVMSDQLGPYSWYGVGGVKDVPCSGVTFHFENSPESSTHVQKTSVAEGLFHEFLFTAQKH